MTDISLLKVFPQYTAEEMGNTLYIESAVYVHSEHAESVDIYKLPVRSQFAGADKLSYRDKQKITEYHLKQCLVYSKYYILTPEIISRIPLVINVKKDDPNFLHIIHTQYP